MQFLVIYESQRVCSDITRQGYSAQTFTLPPKKINICRNRTQKNKSLSHSVKLEGRKNPLGLFRHNYSTVRSMGHEKLRKICL